MREPGSGYHLALPVLHDAADLPVADINSSFEVSVDGAHGWGGGWIWFHLPRGNHGNSSGQASAITKNARVTAIAMAIAKTKSRSMGVVTAAR